MRNQINICTGYSTVYCIRIRTTTCLWYLKGTVQRDFRLPGSTLGPDQRVRICLILVKNLPSYSNFKFKNLIFKIRQNMAVWSTVSQSPQEFDPPMSQCPKGSDTPASQSLLGLRPRRGNLSGFWSPGEPISPKIDFCTHWSVAQIGSNDEKKNWTVPLKELTSVPPGLNFPAWNLFANKN